MPGYNATSESALELAIGVQNLQTQSALSYVANEQILISYALNSAVFMSGTIQSYNGVTGIMVVNITTVGPINLLQPPWNTQPWGSTINILADWVLALVGGVPASTNSVVPQIIVRAVNPQTWDPLWGNGTQNFLTDADAVAQIIAQRLKFLQGEWFENLNIGLPLFQSLLGHPQSVQGVGLILREQILGVPFVRSITAFAVSYVANSRQFTFAAVVQTTFGPVTVTG